MIREEGSRSSVTKVTVSSESGVAGDVNLGTGTSRLEEWFCLTGGCSRVSQ